MTNGAQTFDDHQKGILLKRAEPEIKTDEPWADDALDRSEVANALTNLVSGQKNPLVISLDGYWGTGKTFLLKRWQVELKEEGFESIYFNAWEDDFCDDPLVAIIGQLSHAFTESKFKKVVEKIKESAGPLLMQGVLGVLGVLGVIGTTTDITIPKEALKKLTSSEKHTDSALTKYSTQIKKKKELKKHLQEMSDEVMKDTGKPLVFIIDELDRCRPTFAIELLERVKHIFDIPGIVFVFGVDQDELCSAIKSVYGDINTDTYLRRFFDMPLLLPEANIENFCRHLIEKYELKGFFSKLRISASAPTHWDDFEVFNKFFPSFYNNLDLSLRDVDHCIRAFSFVGKSIKKGQRMFPFLVGILIALRVKNQTCYRDFITQKCFGADVMNYINEVMSDENTDSTSGDALRVIEIILYITDRGRGRDSLGQLRDFLDGSELPHPEYLSEKIKNMDKEQNSSKQILKAFKFLISDSWVIHENPDLKYVSSLIELTQIAAQRKPW